MLLSAETEKVTDLELPTGFGEGPCLLGEQIAIPLSRRLSVHISYFNKMPSVGVFSWEVSLYQRRMASPDVYVRVAQSVLAADPFLNAK